MIHHQFQPGVHREFNLIFIFIFTRVKDTYSKLRNQIDYSKFSSGALDFDNTTNFHWCSRRFDFFLHRHSETEITLYDYKRTRAARVLTDMNLVQHVLHPQFFNSSTSTT